MLATLHRRLVCTLALVLLASPALAEWTHVGAVKSHDVSDGVITLQTEAATVLVQAMNDTVVRVRMAPQPFGRDFSWAVLDPSPQGEWRAQDGDADELRLATGAFVLRVKEDPCRLEIADRDGNVLVRDDAARGMGWNTLPDETKFRSDLPWPPEVPVRVWHEMPEGAAIYGLGEKAGWLSKRGRAWSMWNTDAYRYDLIADPLYQSTPFFMVEQNGRYHGILFDNPRRSSFDFGQVEPGVYSFGAEGGELNYYIIAGPTPRDVLRNYVDLTGHMEMPPKWAIGYHQCRYSYYPESMVRDIAANFRKREIPCDVLYLDIDYMDGFRCFTWDDRFFPDPKGMMDDLHADGFHVVAIVDPGIKLDPDYAVYKSGTAADAWIKTASGSEPFVGSVWPGECVFPDFTKPSVRDWWAGLVESFLNESGLDGFWNDMNEPSVFGGPGGTAPLDVRHDNAGEPASHRACHNIYGMQMLRATLEGLRRLAPDERPFTMTRANYAGGQRYGATWTGDNTSTWEHLRLSVSMVLGMGLSGMPFVGPDIGGFINGATPELYARWIQVGAFFPYCRTHTAAYNPPQEPWSYGPRVEAIAKTALDRRYAWLPYLYTCFEEASRTGTPIMRPTWYDNPWMHTRGDLFLFGPDVLVAPTLYPVRAPFHIEVPGGAWYDLRTDDVVAGGQPIPVSPEWEDLPLFVRAGAILPTQSVVQHTGQQPEEPLILDIWPHGHSTATLYEDDGTTLAYQRGQFRRTTFTCDLTDDELRFRMERTEGNYQPVKRSPLLRIHGLTKSIANANVARPKQADDDGDEMSNSTGSYGMKPGEFRQDENAGVWLVRLFEDDGRPQDVQLTLGEAKPAPKKDEIVVQFDADHPVEFTQNVRPPLYAAGGMNLEIRHIGEPRWVLPRLDPQLGGYPVMEFELAAQFCTDVGVRFATVEDPTLSQGHEFHVTLTPDGRPHTHQINLNEVSGGKWSGTPYFMSFTLRDDHKKGERIHVGSIHFRPDASANAE